MGCTELLAVEEEVVGSAAGAPVAETAAEAQAVLTPLCDLPEATPAPQSAVVEVVLVSV